MHACIYTKCVQVRGAIEAMEYGICESVDSADPQRSIHSLDGETTDDSESELEGSMEILERPLQNPVEPPTTLYWVRMNALRSRDNTAFTTAVSDTSRRFRAVFIVDSWYTHHQQGKGNKRTGLNKIRFLLECLHDLNKQLHRYGTSLYVVKGHPLASLERICGKWNVNRLVFQEDRDIRSDIVESVVERLAASLNIEVLKFPGHTLYSTMEILKSLDQEQSQHKPDKTIQNNVLTQHHTMSMKEFWSTIVPSLGPPNLEYETTPTPPAVPNVTEIPIEYSIPSLSDFGYSQSEALYSNSTWVGGESEALRRLPIYITKRKTQRSVSLEDLLHPTALSPYIRFGCLSPRYLLHRIKQAAKEDTMLEPLAKEVTTKLLQREYYFTVSSQVTDFDQYENCFSLQIPWEPDEILLKSWREGLTGYPWIDASIRQLLNEGWIHHALRESIAVFLTRGDLWQSWVEGKKLFEEYLLDFEPVVSSGCWMKSSCSAFITGPVEHYCPITFGCKIDPHGHFIRRYIPELQNFSDEYIYSPWLAPPTVQEEAGCIVGVDYPRPVIDHRTTGVLCCEKLRSVMLELQKLHLKEK